jgi:hypothetical protein
MNGKNNVISKKNVNNKTIGIIIWKKMLFVINKNLKVINFTLKYINNCNIKFIWKH